MGQPENELLVLTFHSASFDMFLPYGIHGKGPPIY